MGWAWLVCVGFRNGFLGVWGGLLAWVSVATFVLVGIGLVLGLVFEAADFLVGNSFRIFYIHVRCSMLAQCC
ncbi:heme ABC transporter permease, partial [Pseudomonas syringae pv. tagetis]